MQRVCTAGQVVTSEKLRSILRPRVAADGSASQKRREKTYFRLGIGPGWLRWRGLITHRIGSDIELCEW